MSFTTFDLDPKIIKAVENAGYQTPTAIQQEAIPIVLSQKDLIASAQTGTGKTASFLLPAIHLLLQKKRENKNPRMLILAPTRELALQIATECDKYTKKIPFIRKACIFGGMPFPAQKRALSKPVDILIATPGRLLDLLERKYLTLSSIEIFVLDEADRMLDMGFIDDVRAIASKCNKERQTLLFSATMHKNVLSLSKSLQNEPVSLFIKPDLTLKANIEQKVFFVDDISHKMKLLNHLIQTNEMGQSIVFTSTKVLCGKIAKTLSESGFKAEALHGDMSQGKRTKTFQRLKQGKVQFLVATDVASRGLDICQLSHVINFDIPKNVEDYIHRIGRTGRAGAKGIAITYATYQEKPIIARIEKTTNSTLSYEKIEGLEPKGKSSVAKKRPFSFKDKKRNFRGPFRQKQKFSKKR